MRSVKRRFLFTILTAALLMCIVPMWLGAGVFFSRLSNGISNYNKTTEDQMQENLPMSGTVYMVYDCIAVEYSSDDSGETEDAYYYLIDCGTDDKKFMILKAGVNTAVRYQLEDLCEAFYNDNDDLLSQGVRVEGALKKNDKDVLAKYEDWKSDWSEIGIDLSDYGIVPYTFDCTMAIKDYTIMFCLGAGGLTLFLIITILVIVLISKNTKKAAAANYNQQNMYGQMGYIPQQNLGNSVQQPIPQMNNIPQSTYNNQNTQMQDSPTVMMQYNDFNGYQSMQNNNQTDDKVSLDKRNY